MLRAITGGCVAYQAPSVVARTAPAEPSVARTAAIPSARRILHASATARGSPSEAGSVPVSSASSSRFGLIRSIRTPAVRRAVSGAPEVSTAIRISGAAIRAVRARSASSSTSAAGGSEPARTIQLERGASAATTSCRAATAEALSGEPGSLIFVVVPSGSASEIFVRTVAPGSTVTTASPLSTSSRT